MKKIVCILCFSLGLSLASFALPSDTLIVSQRPGAAFSTIQSAVEAVRAYMDHLTVIRIEPGIYREKIIIHPWLQNIELLGSSTADSTILTYDDHANIHRMGTFRTYTLRIDGNNIVLRNLTVENNAPQLGQAVALHTHGDRLAFFDCRFLGNQDTIFAGSPFTRLYFEQCQIEGSTDFIFGGATIWFEACLIVSRRNSYITAASTPKEAQWGFVFNRCKLEALAGVNKVYLGRPWRPYGATLFMNCEMGKHIQPAGWHNWSKTSNEATARYAEYGNRGEGADRSKRVEWSVVLSKNESKKVTPATVFHLNDEGWNVASERENRARYR